MCRIFAMQSDEPVDILPWLARFATACRESKEYQGDGWGIALRRDGAWVRHRSVRPIWDDLPAELPRSCLFLVHARSAFRNEGVVVENNMPFVAGDVAFAFNGELRGVRLSVPGDTGAARLLELFRRFRANLDGDGRAALARLDVVVAARTDYVRALNAVVSDGRDVWVNTRFGEDPEYFTMYRAEIEAGRGSVAQLVTSERIALPGVEPGWEAIPNGTTLALHGTVPC